MRVADERMPADPEPDAARRILYEWLTEIARAVALAERVDPGVAFDALSELIDCTPDPIPQEVLIAAAVRYLPVRRTDDDPGPAEILGQVRAEMEG
jgi:hypothetical protein